MVTYCNSSVLSVMDTQWMAHGVIPCIKNVIYPNGKGEASDMFLSKVQKYCWPTFGIFVGLKFAYARKKFGFKL